MNVMNFNIDVKKNFKLCIVVFKALTALFFRFIAIDYSFTLTQNPNKILISQTGKFYFSHSKIYFKSPKLQHKN